MERLNALLDSVPTRHVWVSGRRAPAFRAAGVFAYHLALVTLLALTLARGLPVDIALGLATVAAVSFFAWAHLRRVITRDERFVLLEHIWFAVGCACAFLIAVGAPLVVWVDLLVVALAVFCCLGRLGCLAAGCCHGHPSLIGVVYREAGADPHPLAGVRLFPTPLVESVGLAGLAAVGVLLVLWGRPGAAALWALAGYGILRFATEGLRGDPRRTVAGVSLPRVVAAAHVAAAPVLDRALRGVPLIDPVLLALLAALVALGLAGSAWHRRRPDLATAAHVAELRAGVLAGAARPADEPMVMTTSQGVFATASEGERGTTHVALSAEAYDTEALARLARVLDDSAVVHHVGLGVVHASFGPPRPPTAPRSVAPVLSGYFGPGH